MATILNPYEAGYSIIPASESDKRPSSESFLSSWQLDILKKPTPKELIWQRTGKGKKLYSYVPTGFVVGLLNRLVNGDWATNIEVVYIPSIPLKKGDSEVVIKLTLTITSNGRTVSKQQFGQHEVQIDESGNANMTLGDALKAAASDGLRKTASLFGIAADLYTPTPPPPKGNSLQTYEPFPEGLFAAPESPREDIQFTHRRAELQTKFNSLPALYKQRFNSMLENITKRMAGDYSVFYTIETVPAEVLPHLEKFVSDTLDKLSNTPI